MNDLFFTAYKLNGGLGVAKDAKIPRDHVELARRHAAPTFLVPRVGVKGAVLRGHHSELARQRVVVG